MANRLLNMLREKDKNGLFTASQTSPSYSTGFTVLDYRNGYKVVSMDRDENVISSYNSLGIVGGTFLTAIGKSGTAKSTLLIQIAANIVRGFDDSAFVQYYDLEQALTYTRIKNVTGFSQADLEDKFVLKQEKNYIEDIFEAIVEISEMKETHKEEFTYDTNLLDEFGKPIRAYVPTVIVLDSIPTIASRDSDGKTAMEGGTYANRIAKALAQFYKRLMPIIKTYNITVMAINHINSKIEINPFAKTQPQLLTMKVDESMPGGNAPIYYANNIFKLTSIGSEKYNMADDGFDGFLSRCDLLKSRTNKAGQFCNLVYNQVSGFDPILSQLRFATESGLVEGRNPYRYFTGYKDNKFDSRKFREAFTESDKIREALFTTTIPMLEKQLNSLDEKNDMSSFLECIERLAISQNNEEFEQESIKIS